MVTLNEALDFMRDSRRAVTVPTRTARVAKFRRQNLSLKLLSPDLVEFDDVVAILEKVDSLSAELAGREQP